MDLAAGGSKPPTYRDITTSFRGINFWTVPDDESYYNRHALEVKQSDKDFIYTELGDHGYEETSDSYILFLVSEQSQSSSSIVNGARNIGAIKVKKDITS
jgi:hypothetical protein